VDRLQHGPGAAEGRGRRGLFVGLLPGSGGLAGFLPALVRRSALGVGVLRRATAGAHHAGPVPGPDSRGLSKHPERGPDPDHAVPEELLRQPERNRGFGSRRSRHGLVGLRGVGPGLLATCQCPGGDPGFVGQRGLGPDPRVLTCKSRQALLLWLEAPGRGLARDRLRQPADRLHREGLRQGDSGVLQPGRHDGLAGGDQPGRDDLFGAVPRTLLMSG